MVAALVHRAGRVSVTTAASRVLEGSVRGVLVVPGAVGLAVVVLGVLDREVRGPAVSGLRVVLVRRMVLGLRLASLRAVAARGVLARRMSEVGVMRRQHGPEPQANRRSAVVVLVALVGLARVVVLGVVDRAGRRVADLRVSVGATWW